MLLLAAVFLLLQSASAFQGLNNAIFAEVARLFAAPDRGVAPRLIALDDRFIQEVGPPPWSEYQWRRIAAGLAKSGIARAYLVDTPRNVIAGRDTPRAEMMLAEPTEPTEPTDRAEPDRTSELLVPTLLVENPADGSLIEETLPDLDYELFTPWRRQVYLPAGPGGLIRGLSDQALAGDLHGRSAFCDWLGYCPGAGELGLPVVPLGAAGALPSVSAADLVRGSVTMDVSPDTIVLVGVTAPHLAQMVQVGAAAVAMPRAEAIGTAIASGLGRRPIVTLGPISNALVFLAVLAVAVALRRFRFSYNELVYVGVAPLVGAGIGIGLYALGLVQLPLTALFVAPLLPAIAAALGNRGLMTEFTQDVVGTIAREGFRHSPRGSLIRSRDDLFDALARLSRTHTASTQCAYFHIDGASGELQFVGGHGVELADLTPLVMDPQAAPWRYAAAQQPSGFAATDFFTDSSRYAQIVPLHSGMHLVGFWCIVFSETEPAPSHASIAELVQWVVSRLALTGPGEERNGEARLERRLETELGHVQELVVAASEERRQQFETLRSLPTPLLVSDLSGAVLYVNSALEQLLGAADVSTVRSLRELLIRVKGEEVAEQILPKLFLQTDASEQVTEWQHPDRRTFQIFLYPIVADAGTPSARQLGYAALFQDVSLSLQLKTLRSTVVDFVANKIRNELMIITGYATLAESATSDGDAREWLQKVVSTTNQVARELSEFRASATLAGEADGRVPTDLTHLITAATDELRASFAQRDIDMDVQLPGVAESVMAAPGVLQRELRRLLEAAASESPTGSSVMIRMSESRNKTDLELGWRGVGLDESQLIRLHGGRPLQDVPMTQSVEALFSIRKAFPEMRVMSDPGQGVRVFLTFGRG